MYTITEKIEIAASAIRFDARKRGINPNNGELDRHTAHLLWEERAAREERMQNPNSHNYNPDIGKTVASEFLTEATERQFKRVINLAVKQAFRW
tara:strand:- start:292 stop:573 length:282 start_codon:yes stop_codon:yes gene_type:complete